MNIRNNRKAVLATASLLAIMAAPAPLYAQQDTSVEAQQSNRGVIIVTANRRFMNTLEAAKAFSA